MHRTYRRHAAHLLAAMRLAFACGAAFSALVLQARGQSHPHIRRWEFEGTVVFEFDEFDLFEDFGVGDAVRGTISFDRTVVGDDFVRPGHPEEHVTDYDHAPQFAIVTLEIDSSFLGETVHFGQDEFFGVSIYDNFCCFLGDIRTPADYYSFAEYLLYPGESEWSGLWAEVEFRAEDAISTTALPEEIQLEDWQVSLYFTDLYAEWAINAEIGLLTPIDVPFVPGDFNGDGDVDARDLGVWRWANGSIDANLAADANLDNRADGADFLAWQRQVGHGAPTLASSSQAPEPGILGLWLAAIPILRRSGKPSSRTRCC